MPGVEADVSQSRVLFPLPRLPPCGRAVEGGGPEWLCPLWAGGLHPGMAGCWKGGLGPGWWGGRERRRESLCETSLSYPPPSPPLVTQG